jgi:hypothetical protein
MVWISRDGRREPNYDSRLWACFWVVSNPPPLPLGSKKEVQEFTAATTVFVGCVLSIISDQLCDAYM